MTRVLDSFNAKFRHAKLAFQLAEFIEIDRRHDVHYREFLVSMPTQARWRASEFEGNAAYGDRDADKIWLSPSDVKIFADETLKVKLTSSGFSNACIFRV